MKRFARARVVLAGSIILGGSVIAMAQTAGQTPQKKDPPIHTPENPPPPRERPQATPQAPDARRRDTAQSSDWQMARRADRATDSFNQPLKNETGAELGRFNDMVIDPSTGRVLYGIVESPEKGTGRSSYRAVPWSAFRSGGERDSRLSLNVDAKKYGGAASFSDAQYPNFTDERWATQTYDAYGEKPYWSGRDVRPAGQATLRDRWYNAPTTATRINELRGQMIRNRQDQEIGQISDVVYDPAHGRALYAVVTRNGKMYNVPWTALEFGQKSIVIDATERQFPESAAFDKDHFPDVTSPRYNNDLYDRFKAPRYWEEPKPAQ